MTMKIKKLDPRAKIPTRSTAGSAGMDLCALLDEPLTVAPGGPRYRPHRHRHPLTLPGNSGADLRPQWLGGQTR